MSRAPVLYVLERYPELSQTFVEGEIRELIAAGQPVEVVALGAGRALGYEPAVAAVYPAGPVARVAALARHPARFVRGARGERFWPPDGSRVRGLLRIAPWVERARRARHIHAHFATEAADIARLLSDLSGTPFSFVAHATDTFRDPGAMRANLAAAAFCVTDCEYNRRHLVEVAPEHAGKVEVMLVGADLERFSRRRPYDPSGPVVAVGRLVEKKGFDDLARAAAVVRDREVLIVGEGPERPALESLIAETGAPVRLLGAVPNEEVRDLMEGASVFVLPCVVAADGDRDGTPTVVSEAMALEVPVLGTEEVGLPELIGPDRGRLVPPRDHDALATAIAGLLATDPDDRVAMGRAGRAWVEQNADRARQARALLALIDYRAERQT
ncbi:MAG: colanic acid/amylovoran biosynthesis glycosyltransferase [Thermoleophilaceae bacterium]|nr:colanic acid/amylovoran biosynthesis glycosyltransferase [Thermoleophilaceae bacterium]